MSLDLKLSKSISYYTNIFFKFCDVLTCKFLLTLIAAM